MSEPAPKTPRASAADPATGAGGGAGPAADSRTWSLLLGLEREARQAETAAALAYTIVNQTRRLIAYRQAILVRRRGPGRFAVEAISNVAAVDRNAPYVAWVRGVLKALDRAGALDAPRTIAPSDAPDRLAADWREWWPAQVAWRPLSGAGGGLGGGLILLRDAPVWSEAEGVLLEQLADAYGHAWRALGGLGRARGGTRRRLVVLGVAAALTALLALPVRQSAIAPAQVAPEDPMVVAAPIDGVIREVLVAPNEAVAAGAPLFVFETAELEANHEVALRALAVAEADLSRAESQAFGDPASKAEAALKQAEVALKRAEETYARSLLERATVTAPTAGVAVFADANAFRGRPVRVGERVLEIAVPARARIAIELPVADAIALTAGSDVRLFLDVAPLDPLDARLERASYEAEETAGGVLAYRVSAAFAETADPPPRIGLRGSAKLYGEPAPLALYLFRRPLSAARQFFGF